MYNIKYYGEWKDFNENNNRLEILKENSTDSQEIRVLNFKINYDDINIFQKKSTYGAGAEITILSENKLQFIDDLYVTYDQEFMIKHYINDELNFVGFLDTQQYLDKFSNQFNYEVELTANNTISLLDKYNLLDNEDLKNTFQNAFDIINYAFDNINYDFSKIHIALSTDHTKSLANDETILHKLFVRTSNYSDEKENVNSCREILNEILFLLTAKLYIIKDEIHIIDINNLAKVHDYDVKVFDYVSKEYIETYTKNDDHLIDINQRIDNFSLKKTEIKNRIDIKFNKYVIDSNNLSINNKTIDNYDTNEEHTIDDITYNYKYYLENENYTVYDPPADYPENLTDTPYFVEKINTKDISDKEYFLRAFPFKNNYEADLTNEEGECVKINTKINLTSEKKYLKIKGKIKVEDITDLESTEKTGNGGYPLYMRVKVKIGQYSRYYANSLWVKNSDYFLAMLINERNDDNYEKNTWIDFDNMEDYYTNRRGLLIELNSDESESENTIEGGELTVSFAFHRNYNDYNYALKDLSFSIMEKDEYDNFIEVEQNDIDFQAQTDQRLINTIDFTNIHGTDKDNISRGGLLLKDTGLYTDSDFATNKRLVKADLFKRENKTDILEYLLLDTYLNNLQTARYILDCKINDIFNPLNVFNLSALKRDNKTVNMITTSLTIDHVNAMSSLILEEIKKD
ncbi:MAG: hypothetical protein ACOCUI_00065 [bacterium]